MEGAISRLPGLPVVRARRGVSQEMLAADSGVSRKQISRLESHPVFPRQDTLDRLTKALDCTEADLTKGPEN